MGTLPESAKLQGAEVHGIATLPKPTPHRVYVAEPVFPHLVQSKVWIIDGDKQDIIGMLTAGYTANFALAPDASQLFVADTYWSLGWRGTRTDLITFYDPQTLKITTDVVLPKGRFLVVPKKQNADVTPDGRYVLSYNLAPATTVSVVDTKEKKYKGEIEIPGCGLIYPSAGNRFSSVCSDGSLATVVFDASLKAKVTRSGQFFDAENDPVFEHSPMDKKRKLVHFISYDGNVVTADLSAEQPKLLPKWSLLTEDDAKEHWRPGGWQVAAVHSDAQQLYVLMHEGPKWTHKQAGHELWVFDLKSRKRANRIKLKDHAISVNVSADGNPQIYTLTEKPSLITYDAKGGVVGEIERLGDSPQLLHVHGH
jgi:methylamine dehydrogenase heavy chain